MSTTNEKSPQERWVGKSFKRKEEARLLRGKGKFVDDIKQLGMLHIRMVRSPYAHAEIKNVDVSVAEKLPGVVCTLIGAELPSLVDPFFEIGPDPSAKIVDYPMAVKKVLYQGEPVAAVIATTRAVAEDAAELVQVDYEPLPPVVDGEESLFSVHLSLCSRAFRTTKMHNTIKRRISFDLRTA